MFVYRLPGFAALVTAASMVAACAVGPDFERPAAPETDRYSRGPLATRTSSSDAPAGQAQHFDPGKEIPAQWWKVFRSPKLNALIERSIKANPTLEAAIGALRVAQENTYAQEGKFFPFIQASYLPSRQSAAQVLSPPLNSPATVFNIHTAQVTVAYTFDVWGLNRRTVESLQALTDSQKFQVEAAYLTLTTNLVLAAIQEASLRAQIDATNKLIALNTKSLDIFRRQLAAGYENRIDVAAQEALLAQIKATLPPLRKALAVQRDLITALSGRFPSEEPPETFVLAALHLPEDLPVSLPSKLVEQRPDVRSAEELLHSSGAVIGVATANMLPNFTMSAVGGYTSTQLVGLINPMNQFWTLAGSATQVVFDGTTLLHQKRAAEAAYDQAAAQYRFTVIAALQNVADTLRALQNDADALRATREFERAAKISLDLVTDQMEKGYANILLLLNAQITYQNAVLARVQAQAARYADTAALFQALGGGWWNRVDEATRQAASEPLGILSVRQ
jgi:NodT family efflux transporter outer membrane factor (OMF) lipoprotein